MRTLLSIAIALSLVTVSGCTEPENNPAAEEPAEVPDHGEPGTAGTANGTNEPPVATLGADVTNGTAPLVVQFTIDASDADGDNLTWTLAIDDTVVSNGTVTPTNLNHTFEAGLWNVTLRVSDGTHNVSRSLDITAVAAEATAPEPIQTSLSWVGGPSACQIWFNDLEGTEYTRYTFPYDVTGMTLTLQYETTGPGVHTRVAFWGASQIAIHDEDSTDLGGTISAVVPEGATYIRVGTCGPGGPSTGDLSIV